MLLFLDFIMRNNDKQFEKLQLSGRYCTAFFRVLRKFSQEIFFQEKIYITTARQADTVAE